MESPRPQQLFKIILTRLRFETILQKLPPSGAEDSILRNNLTSLTESLCGLAVQTRISPEFYLFKERILI